VAGVSIRLDSDAPGARDGEGEVIIYGTGVMAGYHNLADVTKDTLTEDGGLRSGDLGRIDDDGFLFITGRVKELYKLANGKYVAPAMLEEQLQLSPLIAQCVVYGEDQTYNVALVVPDVDSLKDWASENGVTGDPLAHGKTKALYAAEIEKYAKEFKGYERVRDFFFVAEPLTTDNGLLTPTLKLKRRNVVARYESDFKRLYS
jgi:long-chain acyl-CoA synthetase